MLYQLFETQKRLLNPYKKFIQSSILAHDFMSRFFITFPYGEMVNAKNELVYEFLKDYDKPELNITSINILEKEYDVVENIIQDKPFCTLKKLNKIDANTGEILSSKKVMLICAPLSGHYASLLKDTIERTLFEYDVYYTDWKNAKDIPLEDGDFGFADYVHYLQEFIQTIRKNNKDLNVSAMAVCQPTVPLLAACTLSEIQKKDVPDNLILMGGPIDTRKSPTEVNEYAYQHDIEWFRKNVIHEVPTYYKGTGRLVYPGFLQYMGFVSMNMKKHTQAHIDFFNHLLTGADLEVEKHKKFYDEYNAVMDLPAKYYLETLENVFIDQKLAKGTLEIDGEIISLDKLKNINLLTIEGEKDDISGPGQTHAALKLCSNIKNKEGVTIDGVGHYGIFSGSRWRNIIFPKINDFVSEHMENKPKTKLKNK